MILTVDPPQSLTRFGVYPGVSIGASLRTALGRHHLLTLQLIPLDCKRLYFFTTFSDGSLGSENDEGRSKMR